MSRPYYFRTAPGLRRALSLLALMGLVACTNGTGLIGKDTGAPRPGDPQGISVDQFAAVIERIEPVAESLCRAETRGVNCNFRIAVHPQGALPPNAFQTVSPEGRPFLIFTQALFRQVENTDEMAFIIGHEAAHHIAGHIPRTEALTRVGADAGAHAAAELGLDPELGEMLGAALGARRFAAEFELEADALGTLIAARAGYDPLLGAAYFSRMADPGDRFLGTHPPNAARIAVVRRVAAGL